MFLTRSWIRSSIFNKHEIAKRPLRPVERDMKIRAKLYATLTKYAGGSIMREPLEVEVENGATLNNLYDRLGIPRNEVKSAFVNSVMQTPDYELREGDDVGIFPPVGGG